MKKFVVLLMTAAMLASANAALADEAVQTPAPAEEMATPAPAEEMATSAPAEEMATPAPAEEAVETLAPAEETPAPTEEAVQSPVSTTVDIRVDLDERMVVIDSAAVFELYNSKGEMVGKAEEWVGGITRELNMHFDVPEYHIGEAFTLKLLGGLKSLTYNNDKIEESGEFLLGTYMYSDENGEAAFGNSFILSGEPVFEKGVVMYIDGEIQDFWPRARIIDGTAMAPAVLMGNALGVKTYYDDSYNSMTCSVGSDAVYFNEHTAYATAFGNDFYAPHESIWIDGAFYVPVRTFADCFETGIEVYDFYDHIDICLGESAKVREFRNSSPVNRYGISSRTKNLIWISKSEFTVRVYEGSQYNWELINSFPCGIGAYSTPTVTGQFEYIERIRSWDYANYYVGPVLRFYNGYAIHSTLLYYGGGEYDGTVGAHISHGCIRCHPQDINWLDRTVSLGTKIYITE